MPIENVTAVNHANQFIELAGANSIVRLKDNGEIGTRSNAWNRLVSTFSSTKTRETNRRTAEAFKASLLGAAGEYEYKAGNEAYHPKDIFYHFVGLGSSKRQELIQEVFNSGILNEELSGAKPLTGRKIQEVIAHLSEKGSSHIVEKRNELFHRIEEGLGVYKESEAKFIEGNYKRDNLQGIVQMAFDITVDRFRFAERELDGVIANMRQDFNTCIEIGDTDAAKHILGEIAKAGRLQSEIALFDAERRIQENYKDQVANLEQRFNKVSPHLEAIEFHFADLNEEQIQARDELIKIAKESKDISRELVRVIRNAKEHLGGELLDEEQYTKWQDLNDRVEQLDDLNGRIYAASDAAQLKRGHKEGGEPQPRFRNEETHINPIAIVTKSELSSLEAEIARRAEASANGGAGLNAKKSALKSRVSQSAIDQVRQGKSVTISGTIKLDSAENDKAAKASRESHAPSNSTNDDISQLNDEGAKTGIYDPKTRTIKEAPFSTLGKKNRVSLDDGQKAANVARALGTVPQEQNVIAFEAQLARARDAGNVYLEGTEQYNPLKLADIANKRKVDLTKVTPEQKQFFSTLLSLRLADLATDNDGKEFTADEIESIAGKALRYAATLSPAEIAASQARFEDLKNAGLTLLTSASGQELRAISQAPKNISIALSEYLLKASDEGISKDFLLGGGSEYGGQDAATIQRLSINLAALSLRSDARQLVFSDIIASNSPYRSGYLAAAALTNNAANRENIAATSASSELFTAFGNLAVQLGTAAGVPIEDLNQLINSFNNASDRLQYQDLIDGSVNSEALRFAGLDSDQAAKDMFNVLDGYVGVRGERIAAVQVEEEARFQRQMEIERAAVNNPNT